MAQTPVSDQTTFGFEPPRNTQFSVFLDNRVGQLLDLTGVFEGHALTMAGLSVIDSADHAVVRVLTSRSDLARRLEDSTPSGSRRARSPAPASFGRWCLQHQ